MRNGSQVLLFWKDHRVMIRVFLFVGAFNLLSLGHEQTASLSKVHTTCNEILEDIIGGRGQQVWIEVTMEMRDE